MRSWFFFFSTHIRHLQGVDMLHLCSCRISACVFSKVTNTFHSILFIMVILPVFFQSLWYVQVYSMLCWARADVLSPFLLTCCAGHFFFLQLCCFCCPCKIYCNYYNVFHIHWGFHWIYVLLNWSNGFVKFLVCVDCVILPIVPLMYGRVVIFLILFCGV